MLGVNFQEIHMTAPFDAASTTDEVLAGADLRGKRILVTGVSAGLGVETARSLAAHGALVIGAARDLAKAKAATEIVRKDAANGGGIELIELDLANLASVRACADTLVAAGKPLDVIIANAGVIRHQSSWAFCLRQPHCLAVETRRPAGELGLLRPPVFQYRSDRPEFYPRRL
jgi:NAD(P)-dependent dehydrogenase (short-subunit alcohol dehydrogenase family)